MKVDIKTKAELAQMREACRMSAEIRDICAAAVAPGVTTGEIDDLVVEYCKVKWRDDMAEARNEGTGREQERKGGL